MDSLAHVIVGASCPHVISKLTKHAAPVAPQIACLFATSAGLETKRPTRSDDQMLTGKGTPRGQRRQAEAAWIVGCLFLCQLLTTLDPNKTGEPKPSAPTLCQLPKDHTKGGPGPPPEAIVFDCFGLGWGDMN